MPVFTFVVIPFKYAYSGRPPSGFCYTCCLSMLFMMLNKAPCWRRRGTRGGGPDPPRMHALSLITLPAQTPIPPQGYDGYAFGSCGAPAHLEVFLDLVCSDCKAIWPTVERVADAYGPAALELTVHTFPLPYHTWAFHAGQSLHAIAAHNRSAMLPVRLDPRVTSSPTPEEKFLFLSMC